MIIQATPLHLMDAMFIYRSCAMEMNERGLFNWNTAYPSLKEVQQDISQGSLFIYQHQHTSIAAECLNTDEPEEYREAKWKYELPALVVHRMAVFPTWRNMKIAEKLMDFAYGLAREKGFKSIRLDAITSNPQAIRLYEKCGYEETGHIHFGYQKDLFRCMERRVTGSGEEVGRS